jgi:hypothetical protein
LTKAFGELSAVFKHRFTVVVRPPNADEAEKIPSVTQRAGKSLRRTDCGLLKHGRRNRAFRRSLAYVVRGSTQDLTIMLKRTRGTPSTAEAIALLSFEICYAAYFE